MLPDSRKKWMQVANIYPKMSAQDQDRLQSRMTSWSNLSQKEQRLARENYLASLKFPAEKKAEAWTAYQKLSDEQKKKLADLEAKKKTDSH
uniref:Transmembrane protein n=1 Tax=Polynucleobacter necessarius subsp. necessarius (strain STIR1) TaxID=452638 RepID=B1XUI5_POLNS